jgi:hypothetical protein
LLFRKLRDHHQTMWLALVIIALSISCCVSCDGFGRLELKPQADAGKTDCWYDGKTPNMPVSSQDVANNPSVNVGEPIVAAGVPIS